MAAKKSRVQALADLEKKLGRDYDPEDNAPGTESDSEGSEEDVAAGREHYVSVGKSRLRQQQELPLGPEYRGKRTSRAALDESSEGDSASEDDVEGSEESGSEEFDDPETADLAKDSIGAPDEEIDSDEAFGSSDEEAFKDFTFRGSSKPKDGKVKRNKRPTAADFMSGSEDEDDMLDGLLDLEAEESENDESGSDAESGGYSGSELSETKLNGAELSDTDASDSAQDSDVEGEDEEDEEEDEGASEDDEEEDPERAELRKLMSEGPRTLLANVSQAAKADAEKGLAVRQQRRGFDSLLNIRIRLQKALISANSFNVADNESEAGQEPYQAAEEAAVKLWNTIDSFRSSILPESTAGQKRKREEDAELTAQDMWDEMEATEKRAVSYRKKVLNKWSTKIKSTTAVATTRKIGSSATQSLVSVLEDQLLNSERLVKRTQMPRSCAPIQAAKKVGEDPEIYDDGDFYQLLLKELVDQRTMDPSAPGSAVSTVRWSALKEAKTRKQVDRKASKGRKLRFTVHEKLQNFMAPENRNTWEADAVDRFFGTLFGKVMELGEEEESDEEMGGVAVEDTGLRLFG
ncbi:TRAUB-domain-containing protein [Pleurostoma richardsiae]|uniref:Protein BFR2 n=1 Tax=Pleurostoma richardsiae TaxID=41990 RepID=A0AA38VHE9_9PEZI|nr:TRAUB-domain-containing protein [Pleurostoma richardsiae]